MKIIKQSNRSTIKVRLLVKPIQVDATGLIQEAQLLFLVKICNFVACFLLPLDGSIPK